MSLLGPLKKALSNIQHGLDSQSIWLAGLGRGGRYVDGPAKVASEDGWQRDLGLGATLVFRQQRPNRGTFTVGFNVFHLGNLFVYLMMRQLFLVRP